jgi:predicted PurR-regulated permease PerM
MNKKASSTNTVTQSLFLVIICSVGLIAFVFMIILPYNRAAQELAQDTNTLKNRIDEQRILLPVFNNLLNLNQQTQSAILPTPKKGKLAREDINAILALFQELARHNALKVVELTPDINSISDSSGHLLTRLILQGDFLNFRNFLLDLGTIPSFESVEEVTIRPIEGSREMRLKIWLAQE